MEVLSVIEDVHGKVIKNKDLNKRIFIMEIKPIRTEDDYQAVMHEVDSLLDSQPDTPAGDRLDVLVTLIEAYEANHFPIPEPDDPVQVIEYYMDSRGLSRSDLIPYLGSKERVSEVLNRKRGLSLEMIRRLHAGLGIPADLLVGSQPSDRGNRKTTGTRPDLRA